MLLAMFNMDVANYLIVSTGLKSTFQIVLLLLLLYKY